jgi:hypothetical protein
MKWIDYEIEDGFKSIICLTPLGYYSIHFRFTMIPNDEKIECSLYLNGDWISVHETIEDAKSKVEYQILEHLHQLKTFCKENDIS